MGEHQERLDSLLDLFSDCGSSYQDLIASLKEDSSMFSSAEVEDLKFLIELGDFCNWYPDLVVSAYTLLHKENSPYKPCAKSDSLVSEEDLPGAWKLEYLLKYGDASGSEPNFWGEVIEKTAERYACWCREVALALPLDLFPGTTANEQKQIAIRTLKERLRAKFPQTELKLKLSEAFSADDSEKPWKDLVWKLQSEPWTDFDLNASDLEVFLKKSSAAHAQDDGIPEATASDDEKEKIRTLQRLFRLTNNPQAIAYLVRNDFDSASKIALSDEENFVAKHGLGMGDKELATDIHRLAKNFVANATLDIERYHGNLNESDNTILSLPRGLQNESLSSQRARSLARNVRSVGNNVAKRRLQNKDYANWKTLFGSINRNSGTQNHTLHIVGRTRGEPHAYYYRRYEATALYGGNWTPWEEVPVEIDGAAIQPAILGGHLYITWLQVIQGQRQKKTGESGGKQAAVSVEYYAELRLKWTAFTGVKWTGVKVGKQAVYDVSENQLDFILGENESLAERYFVIDVSDNSDALSLQVWRTFPDFVDTPHVVTVPVANSAPMVGDVDGLDNAPATTYILKTEVSREYRADQRINHVGNFSLAQDGSDTASNQVEPNTGNPIAFTYGEFVKNHSPSGCRLVGNLFYNAGGSLVLQDGTKIFGNTRGPFKLLSVNMGFICHEDRPFFYMDSKGVFLVRTVSGDGGSGANSIPNYHVEMVSNPQAGEFRRRFLQGGPKWLYSRETEALPVSDSYYYSYSYYNYYFSVYLGYYTAGDWQAWDLSQTLFEHGYLPGSVVAEPYPSSTVDFCWGSATSIYNWELFFFVPMLLADRMLAEQNYEAALNWLQLVFDPRIDLTPYERTKRFVRELSKGARYWKFLPFFANPDADRSILSELSFPTPHDALPDRKAIQLLIDRWKNDPFNPQMIARYRPVAYQKYVVMKYLDALIGWGDQLFSQDTTESVNLAVQMYILAAEILGPKSAEVPDPKNVTVFSVRELMAKGVGVMNNAFVTYEDTMLTGKSREKATPQRLLPGCTMQLAHTTGMMFYFNVPRNETLAGYWDTVADRLYKIRNSLNMEGVKRTLALFAPPIDPTMLVKAKANGVSISEALTDASSALPYYRFKGMVAKAIEIVRDVMRMGRNLLDILEKHDAESLAVLRASHERTMLALQKTVTDMDVAELEKELESVETEQENAAAERAEQEEYYKPLKLEEQYARFMEKVRKVQETVESVKKAASVAYKIPDLDIGAIANGLGGPSFSALSAGGTKIAENLVNEAESYASRFVQRQVSAAKMKLQA